jgi:5'-nucleotidase
VVALTGTVLVANDDGINASGLWLLIGILLDLGFNVFFASTSDPYSGAGKSITWSFKAERRKINGVEGVIANASPSTAVLFSLRNLGIKPDFIVSGINHGANLGIEDVHTSGTFGAALEGVLQGYPSMAVSKYLAGNNSQEEIFNSDDKRYLKTVIEAFWSFILDEDSIECMPLNVNLPWINPRGIAITRLSSKVYNSVRFEEEDNGVYSLSRGLTGFYDDGVEECNDIWAVYNSYVSITPVCVRCLLYGNSRGCLDRCNLRRLIEGLDNGVYCL